MAVLKKMASRELPTTTYMGRPMPKAIRGTIKGPPPNPNIEATIAITNPPIHPITRFTLNF
jgi:hypothetical protein